ncbi:MAG: hypothetical protein M3R21_01495 [Candidatus Dormibacteraeota bacterium]|nr:hypothetical protein [Candidatus Dormibacteraeota bacterium]
MTSFRHKMPIRDFLPPVGNGAPRPPFSILLALVLTVALFVAACGSGPTQTAKKLTFTRGYFNAKNFVDPRVGSNKWLPLKPGTQWVRDGTTLVGNRKVPHKVLSTVTDVIRVINGVKTVAVFDHSVDSGQVVQQSLDYFAQDKSGNIWDVGAATEQYEAGRFVTVDEAWIAGVDGAKPGILMPANPTSSTPPWSIAQPPHESGDAAAFQRMQKRECVPFGCFDNVLVVEEGKRSALNNEYKYFGRGVGQIRNEPLGASRHQDIETLVNFTKLSPAGLAEASKEAMRIDAEAARLLPKLFGKGKASRT